MACDITPRELEAILTPLTPGARSPVMRYLRAVFFFGIKRGYLVENPVVRLDFAERKRHGTAAGRTTAWCPLCQQLGKPLDAQLAGT